MAQKSFSEKIAEIIIAFRDYTKAKINYWKLSLLEKASLAGTFFLSSIISVVIGAICLLFLSFAFAYWFGKETGNPAVGFLIVAGFYILMAVVLIVGWKSLVSRPLTKGFSSIILKDDEPDKSSVVQDKKK